MPNPNNVAKILQDPCGALAQVCPPMSSLGSSFRAHRLPLHQWQRSPPIDVAPFESLSGHLEQYVEAESAFQKKNQRGNEGHRHVIKRAF